jgi:hypothetical protein
VVLFVPHFHNALVLQFTSPTAEGEVGLLLNYFDKLLDQPQWLDTHVARIQRDNHAVTTIDVYSLSTVPVEQYFNGTSLGTATAFIWERKEAFYLITNWHVVTCRDHTEGKHLHTHAGEPNTLRALLNPREQRFTNTSAIFPSATRPTSRDGLFTRITKSMSSLFRFNPRTKR